MVRSRYRSFSTFLELVYLKFEAMPLSWSGQFMVSSRQMLLQCRQLPELLIRRDLSVIDRTTSQPTLQANNTRQVSGYPAKAGIQVLRAGSGFGDEAKNAHNHFMNWSE
jgi:hypothetical protein